MTFNERLPSTTDRLRAAGWDAEMEQAAYESLMEDIYNTHDHPITREEHERSMRWELAKAEEEVFGTLWDDVVPF